MQNWESLIAERSRPAERMAESIAKESDLERRRKYDQSPKRKASHKAWAKSESGRKSEHERGKRYRATEKGRQNKRKNQKAYYDRHKDDPEWREHKRALLREWNRKNREHRLAYERERRARKRAEKKAKEAA